MRLIGTVLANVMIFGGTVFYPYYRPGDAHWHISPIADQVAAGGLMMVEESLLTIGLFCWLFLRVARENEERQELLDYASQHGIVLDEHRAQRAVAAGHGDELWERLRQGRSGRYLTVRVPTIPGLAVAGDRAVERVLARLEAGVDGGHSAVGHDRSDLVDPAAGDRDVVRRGGHVVHSQLHVARRSRSRSRPGT